MSTSRSRGRITSAIVLSVSILLVLLAWTALPLLVFLLKGRAEVLFHLDPVQFLPLTGSLVAGSQVLLISTGSQSRRASSEPWLGAEQWSWLLIGGGMLLWSLGECFRLFSLSRGQQGFPSLADAGFATFLSLLFIALLLQPGSFTGRKRGLALLDILIWIGPALAITFPLYQDLFLHPITHTDPATGLKWFYLLAEMLLFGCIALLLLRSTGSNHLVTARRPLPFLISLSLCLLVTADFLVHIHPLATSNAHAPWFAHIPWYQLCWLTAMLLLGLTATLRHFLPATSQEQLEQRLHLRSMRSIFGPIQLVPYIPLIVYLLFQVTTTFITPLATHTMVGTMLLLSTITLLILRQLLTLMENGRLTRIQKNAYEQHTMEKRQREVEYRLTENRLHAVEQRNIELITGMNHFKEVLARQANGDLRARARIAEGELLPMATSFNLMADRLVYLEQNLSYAQQLVRALTELTSAIEEYRTGAIDYVVVPPSCRDISQIDRLVLALGLKYQVANSLPLLPSVTATEQASPVLSGSFLPAHVPDLTTQRLSAALADLTTAIEYYRAGGQFSLSPSSTSLPEMQRLLIALGLSSPPSPSPNTGKTGPRRDRTSTSPLVPEEQRQPRRPRIQPIEMNEGQ